MKTVDGNISKDYPGRDENTTGEGGVRWVRGEKKKE